EAANITSYQMRDSFGDHQSFPGRVTLNTTTPSWVRRELTQMGYELEFEERTSGPLNAIFVDRTHGTLWGGSSNYGQDYGVGW
ncbi:MAG TPA: gamma-glutamyltransferase family protein, partial [Myxococcota bacterium]|nr:gamma-glutamyltransferase family protein [Myxococcota bacterium]